MIVLEIIENTNKYSDEWFLGQYLKYGSVEEALKSHPDSLPISVANYHRLVKKYGLIKSAGRHVSLPETLHFFREKAMEPGTPLERIYTRMPPSFQTSLSTLHRIYQLMEKSAVRRYAAALIITVDGKLTSVLVGQEVFGNSRYGKRVGDLSIPMSFAKKDENCFDSVLRVLQQEVFSGHASRGKLGQNSTIVKSILKTSIEPFMYLDIVDVKVSVFRLVLPENLTSFISYKLVNHKFEDVPRLLSENLRVGVGEILKVYEDYLTNPYTVKFPSHHVSAINSTALAFEPGV